MATKEARHLPVRTVYYHLRDVVKTIAAGSPLNAVKNCVGYMRTNKYGATHAEVYNTDNGRLYGVITNKMTAGGKLRTNIEYEHKPSKEELAQNHQIKE